MDDPSNDDCIANAFRRSGVPTLAEVRNRIAADPKLDPIRRRDVCSALNTMAKAAGGTPEQISADFMVLRRRTADFHPVHARISGKRWQNIKSDVAFALRHLGLNNSAGRYLAPYRRSWQPLASSIKDDQLRWHLSRLFHLCSALGLDPEDVGEEVKEHLRKALHAESMIKDPDLLVRRTIADWNKAARTVPGWPAFTFRIEDQRHYYTIPIERFPDSFQTDVASYLARVGAPDPFRTDGPKRSFAPATLRQRRYQIRSIASALVLTGTPIDEVRSLADLVAPKALETALTFYWRRNGQKMSTNIHGMAITMLAIARHHVRLSQTEIDRIVELAERTDARKPGLTDRNMERLRQFLDPRNVTMLLGLPSRLQREAERRGKPDERAAVLMQVAVAIELLLMTMLRRKNLVGLSEAVHVKWSQAGRKGVCHIAIEGHEVKNGEALHFELPTRSAGLLRVYMERYQPLLGTKPSAWLFPGRYGDTPKNASGFSIQIADTIFAFTGIRMHVHMFRHTGALLYLQRNPGGYEVLKRVFGHRYMETTASIYCGLEMLSSAKHFDEEILAHDDSSRRRSQRTPAVAKRAKRRSAA